MWVLPAFVLKWGTLIIYFLLWLFIIRMTPVCRSISLSFWFLQSSRWLFFFQHSTPSSHACPKCVPKDAGSSPLVRTATIRIVVIIIMMIFFFFFFLGCIEGRNDDGGKKEVGKKRPKERRRRRRNVKLVEDIFFFWSASTLKETLKSLWVFFGGE